MTECGFIPGEDEEGETVAVCPKCTKYIGRQYAMSLRGKNTGEFLQPRRLKQNFIGHLESTTHSDACTTEADREREAEKNVKIGQNLTRLVMQTIREAGSYQSFERKVFDFYEMGGRVGHFSHSCKFIAGMVKAMHAVVIETMVKWLHAVDPLTGKPRVFAACADKVTEQNRTGQAIGLLFFDEGEVKPAFIDYVLAKDGTGKGIAHDIMEMCMMGTLEFTREQLAQQLVGFAADGQYFKVNVMEELVSYLLQR